MITFNQSNLFHLLFDDLLQVGQDIGVARFQSQCAFVCEQGGWEILQVVVGVTEIEEQSEAGFFGEVVGSLVRIDGVDVAFIGKGGIPFVEQGLQVFGMHDAIRQE